MDALVGACKPIVRSVIARTLRGTDLAADREDTEQDAIERIITKLDQLREPQRFPGWVAAIAQHSAAHFARGRSKSAGLGDYLDQLWVESSEPTVDAAIDRLAVSAVLTRAIQRLSRDHQRVIACLMQSDRPNYREASVTLNRSIGSLGPTRRRALDRLRSDPAVRSYAR